jgi:hypothetical protein
MNRSRPTYALIIITTICGCASSVPPRQEPCAPSAAAPSDVPASEADAASQASHPSSPKGR